MKVELPIATVSLNGLFRMHRMVMVRKARKQRLAAALACAAPLRREGLTRRIGNGLLRWEEVEPTGPLVVRLVRISRGRLDDDNLRGALKSVRDGVADALGVADNDPRIRWTYGQEHGETGIAIVVVPRLLERDRGSDDD